MFKTLGNAFKNKEIRKSMIITLLLLLVYRLGCFLPTPGLNRSLYESIVADKEELRGHQKRAQRVDEHKTKWALLHSIPILRFWESDIRKNPKKVMKILKEELGKRNRQIMLENNKKKRH